MNMMADKEHCVSLKKTSFRTWDGRGHPGSHNLRRRGRHRRRESRTASPICPELVGRWPYGPCETVAVEGNIAYFGSGTVLIIAECLNPTAPAKIGQIALPDVVLDVAVSGCYAYVADDQAGCGSSTWPIRLHPGKPDAWILPGVP